MPKTRDQLTRKKIEARLDALGVTKIVRYALAGSAVAVQRLQVRAEDDPFIRSELELLLPRRAKQGSRTVKRLSSLEKAGRRAGKYVVLVQGGSPGLKKR